VEKREINRRFSQDGGWRFETNGCLARKRVIGIEGVAKSIHPEGFRNMGADKCGTNKVANGSIRSFCNTIELRGMWGTRIMMNAGGAEVILELI
jgi:hypothetical protein